jgi:hypothetical protein
MSVRAYDRFAQIFFSAYSFDCNLGSGANIGVGGADKVFSGISRVTGGTAGSCVCADHRLLVEGLPSIRISFARSLAACDAAPAAAGRHQQTERSKDEDEPFKRHHSISSTQT